MHSIMVIVMTRSGIDIKKEPKCDSSSKSLCTHIGYLSLHQYVSHIHYYLFPISIPTHVGYLSLHHYVSHPLLIGIHIPSSTHVGYRSLHHDFSHPLQFTYTSQVPLINLKMGLYKVRDHQVEAN